MAVGGRLTCRCPAVFRSISTIIFHRGIWILISRERCLEALQEAAEELGHKPTVKEHKSLDISPMSHSLIAHFGWCLSVEFGD